MRSILEIGKGFNHESCANSFSGFRTQNPVKLRKSEIILPQIILPQIILTKSPPRKCGRLCGGVESGVLGVHSLSPYTHSGMRPLTGVLAFRLDSRISFVQVPAL